MSLGEFLAGSVLFGATLAAVTAAALALVPRDNPPGDRLARSVAVGLVATVLLVAAHVVPLALGVLSRGSVLMTGAAILGAALLARGRLAGGDGRMPKPVSRRVTDPSTALAVVTGLLVGAAVLAVALRDGTTALDHVDMVSFHLPVVADWIQSGSAWQITQHIPQQAQGAYPHNGDVLLLAVVLPWHSDFLVRFAEYPFLVLAAAALVAAARELGCTRSTAALVALALVSVPAVLHSAVGQAMPDTVLVAGFACALLFVLRHARTRSHIDLALAGAGLGLGFGTKWYGVSSAAIAIALWALFAAYRARRAHAPLRPVVAGAAILTAVTAAVGGFWLVRNLVETGNPVFPVEVTVLGVTLFDAPPDPIREKVGFSIAHYAGDPAVWREHLLPALRAAFGAGGALLVGLAVAGLAVGLRRRVLLVAGLGAAAVTLAFAYAITPYTALGFEGAPVAAEVNARYAVPALIAAAGLAAWGLARAGPRLLVVGEIALAAVAIAGLRDSLDVPWGATSAVAGTMALVGLAGRRLAGARPPWLRSAGLAAGVLLLAGALGGGFALARDFEQDRYRGEDPVLDRVLERVPTPSTVGLTGIWDSRGVAPVLAAYGDGLENRVRYVGQVRDGMLERHETETGFRADLARRPVDAVVMGRAQDIYSGVGPREQAWLLRGGFRRAATSDRFILFVR